MNGLVICLCVCRSDAVKDILDDASHSIVTIGVSASNSPKFLELLFQLADMYEIKAEKETTEGGPKEKTVSVYIAGDLQNVKGLLSHFRVRFQIREERAADFMRDVNMADARLSVDFGKAVEGGRLDRFHVMVSRDFVQ